VDIERRERQLRLARRIGNLGSVFFFFAYSSPCNTLLMQLCRINLVIIAVLTADQINIFGFMAGDDLMSCNSDMSSIGFLFFCSFFLAFFFFALGVFLHKLQSI
jgi:hypothetical protein